jgi:hypothetical protein
VLVVPGIAVQPLVLGLALLFVGGRPRLRGSGRAVVGLMGGVLLFTVQPYRALPGPGGP